MKRALLFIVVVALLALSAGYVRSLQRSYHHFEKRCRDCHLTRPGTSEKKLTFTKDLTAMCTGCHSDIKGLTHPVDVKPSMAVPAIFPLDWRRALTCVSCHTVHRPGYGDYHLRVRARGQGFCIFCHSDLEKEIHKVAVGTAHMQSGLMDTVYRPGDVLIGVTLDELSLKCLSCHDATFSTESSVTNPAIDRGFHSDAPGLGVSHPIGVSYIMAKRKYRGAYRDIRKLPPQIKLFAGMVGCGSCHNPYSSGHAQLVMSNTGSALCLACHVK